MMRSLYAIFATALLGVLGFTKPATACSTTTACEVPTGEYVITLPDDNNEQRPAIVFVHGFGGSGPGVFRNTSMVTAFTDRGYAVIAPSGLPRTNGNGGSWSFHPDRTQRRDEIAFLTSVRDDAIARHGIDPDKIILAGFSIGGSMTAYMACAVPETFAAYAPVGGNFWRPHPVACEGPVRMLHTHGWSDGTVPLEGRVVNRLPADDPNAFAQGDIFHALNIWREANGCRHLKADRFKMEGQYWRRAWDRCTEGSALEFALHPGGHTIPQGWADLVVDWFEAL